MESNSKSYTPQVYSDDLLDSSDYAEIMKMHCLKKWNNPYVPELFKIWEASPDIAFLAKINLAHDRYKLHDFSKEIPTQKQLIAKIKQTDKKIKNIQSFFTELLKDEEKHFWMAIASANFNGTSIGEINRGDMDRFMGETITQTNKLCDGLEKLKKKIEPCLKDSFFDYRSDIKRADKAESTFILELSSILTEHLGEGGYGKNEASEEPVTGWKIDCISYILKKANVQKTRMQILNVIE